MKLPQAWSRVALAGRELGSGPLLAAERFPYASELVALGVLPEKAEAIALGVLVGQVMAETQDAMNGLRAINREWLRGDRR